MSEEPKKPTAGFWITVALVVLLVGYPLSFGPACWWFSPETMPGISVAPIAYWPFGWAALNGPNWVTVAISRYALLSGRRSIVIPAQPDNGGYYLP